MNLKLKTTIKELLANGQDLTVDMSETDLESLLNYNGLMRGLSYYHEIIESASITDGNVIIKDLYSLREFINNLNLDYCNLTLIENRHVLTWNYKDNVKEMNSILKDEFLDRWTNDRTVKRAVVTHLNCSDGTGTAAVVNHYEKHIVKAGEEIDYIFLNYKEYDINEVAKKLAGKLVYVGDFSFLEDELSILEDVVESMVIIDHHESPFKSSVGNKNYVHLDMTKSGALLAWKFFFKETDIHMPYIISLISDRDLWNFFHGNISRALAIMVDTKGQDIIYNYMTNPTSIGDSMLHEDLEPYIEEVEDLDKRNKKLAKRALPCFINGVKFHGMNYTSKPSDLLNTISTVYGTPSMSYFINDKGITFSLRNAKDDISVEDIAKSFGGGGHFQAAGFSFEHHEFDYNEFFKTNRVDANVSEDNEEHN